MEILNVQIRPNRNLRNYPKTKSHMNSLFSKLKPKQLWLNPSISLCSKTCLRLKSSGKERAFPKKSSLRVSAKVAASDVAQLRENWLESLTCPTPNGIQAPNCTDLTELTRNTNADSNWVIGIDPDISGALALLKIHDSGCSAEVFDSPHLKVMVGKRVRKRLDAKSMAQLLLSFNAPLGTTAYIEQSIPFPQDGKLGWWNGGFGYGLWIGILVASGFSVVPVPSFTWKSEFEFTGGKSTKDDCRRIASTLFPSLSSSLKRKKDHGRAEALLIASYGRGLKMKSAESCVLQEVP